MKSELNDTLSISLSFRDGSIATIHYFANGSKSVSKERIEIYASNGVLQINNFKELKVFGWNGSKNKKLWSQDKGQNACVEAFSNSILNNEENPIPIDEIFEVTDVTLKLAEMV
jgi:predicted dehydrogenase